MSNATATPSTNLNRARQNKLVAEYGPLVDRIARQMHYRIGFRMELDELRSAGWIGLMEAVRRFDGDRSVPFGAFAQTRVTGAILDETRQRDYLSRPDRTRARRVNAAKAQLIRTLNREPTDVEIAGAVGESIQSFHEQTASEYARSLVHIEDLSPEHRDSVAGSGRNADEELADNETVRTLAGYVAKLPKRDQQVLADYYRDELPMREIGRKVGVSESRVCQLMKATQMKLRQQMQLAA